MRNAPAHRGHAAVALALVASCTSGNLAYRGQIAAVDTVAMATLAISNDMDGTAGEIAVVGGVFTYLAGGPLVHYFHDDGTAGGHSLLIRVAAPGLAGLVGHLFSGCEKPCYGSAGMGYGLLAGAIGAMLWDVTRGVPDEMMVTPLSGSF